MPSLFKSFSGPFFSAGQIVPFRADHSNFPEAAPRTAYDRIHSFTQAFSNGVGIGSYGFGPHFSAPAALTLAVVTGAIAGAAVFFAPPVAAAIGAVGKVAAYGTAALFGGLSAFGVVQAAATAVTHPSRSLQSERGYGLVALAGFIAPWALACTVGFNAVSMAKNRIVEAESRPSEIWNVHAKDCNAPEVQKKIANVKKFTGVRVTCTPQ